MATAHPNQWLHPGNAHPWNPGISVGQITDFYAIACFALATSPNRGGTAMKRFYVFVATCVCLCDLGGFQPSRAQQGFSPQDIPKQAHCQENYRDGARPREWLDEGCASSLRGCESDCAGAAERREARCCGRCEPRELSEMDCRDQPREPEQNCNARDDHGD